MNNLKLPVAELKQALPGFSKVIRKSTLPVLQTIRLTRQCQGKVTIQATDLDTYVTYTASQAQPGDVIDVLVPLDQLSKTLKESGSKDLAFGLEGKDLCLRYLHNENLVEQKLTTLPVSDFPPMPSVSGPSMSLGMEFGQALKEAMECASKDTTRYVLNGVYLDVEDKQHYVVGSNGTSLYAANSFSFALKKSLIIPHRKFLGWAGFMTEGCTLSVEPATKRKAGWIQFATPQWTCITREIEGQYPKWKPVVPNPTKQWSRVKLGDEGLKQLIQAIPKMPDHDPYHIVRLSISEGLTLEGREKDDKEWIKVPIPDATTSGKSMIVLNREYVLKALRFGLNEIEVEAELSPAIFSKPGKKLVVMPVRLGENPVPPKPETERKPMPRGIRKETPSSPSPTPAEPHKAPIVLEQIERIKEVLKNVIRDMNLVQDTLKREEKEKRTTEREIELIRSKLRKIQSVTI